MRREISLAYVWPQMYWNLWWSVTYIWEIEIVNRHSWILGKERVFASHTSAHAAEFITSTPLLAAHPGCSHKNRASLALMWINSQFPEGMQSELEILHCTLLCVPRHSARVEAAALFGNINEIAALSATQIAPPWVGFTPNWPILFQEFRSWIDLFRILNGLT